MYGLPMVGGKLETWDFRVPSRRRQVPTDLWVINAAKADVGILVTVDVTRGTEHNYSREGYKWRCRAVGVGR